MVKTPKVFCELPSSRPEDVCSERRVTLSIAWQDPKAIDAGLQSQLASSLVTDRGLPREAREEADVLQLQDLLSSFSSVVDLGGSVARGRDVLPKSTFHYHVRFADSSLEGNDLLVTSENILDDEFAMFIFSHVPPADRSEKLLGLRIRDLPKNKYGFSALVLAPKDYHSEFKGRLDKKRERLVLCLPIHRCEFSGDESIEDFYVLRREVVPTLNWEREICPKTVLRFDNPKTRGGTRDSGVFAKYATVLHEVDNLSGVPKGFVEIGNYRKQVIEILSPREDEFLLIRDRKDENREAADKETLLQKVRAFLVQPS